MSIRNQLDHKRTPRLGWGLIRVAVVMLLIVAGLAAIIVSPLLFRLLARYTTGWADMANVGEAYGGVGAVLAGLALSGIVVSLLVQWRQSHADRTLAVRQHHFELIKLGLDEPLLLRRMAGSATNPDMALKRIHANLWVAHWAMLWDLKYCDEQQLRNLVAPFFAADPEVRDWWQVHAPNWSAKWNRHRRRFQTILTEECNRASVNSVESVESARPKATSGAALVALGVLACGAVTVILWARRRAIKRAALQLGEERPPARGCEEQHINGDR